MTTWRRGQTDVHTHTGYTILTHNLSITQTQSTIAGKMDAKQSQVGHCQAAGYDRAVHYVHTNPFKVFTQIPNPNINTNPHSQCSHKSQFTMLT